MSSKRGFWWPSNPDGSKSELNFPSPNLVYGPIKPSGHCLFAQCLCAGRWKGYRPSSGAGRLLREVGQGGKFSLVPGCAAFFTPLTFFLALSPAQGGFFARPIDSCSHHLDTLWTLAQSAETLALWRKSNMQTLSSPAHPTHLASSLLLYPMLPAGLVLALASSVLCLSPKRVPHIFPPTSHIPSALGISI